jgi:hypothetical protein
MRVAIVDGDTLSYRSAAASEKRSVIVKHLKSGREKEFKNRTEFVEFLKEKGIEYKKELYSITDKQEPEPESHCCQMISLQVKKIGAFLNADHVEIYIGGENNFREKLELPSKYKGNRADMLRPILLDSAKTYVMKQYAGGLVTGMEADDMLHIRAYELLRSGHEPILCSQDKDARQGVGLTIYNWTLDNPVLESIPVFGDLRFNKAKNKVEGEGLKWLGYQLLFGDPTDNYKPCELSKTRFGAISAYNLLKDTKTVDELFSVVEKQYKDWYPSPVKYLTWNGEEVSKDWKGILDMYFKCAYMLRQYDDETTFSSLWREFGS